LKSILDDHKSKEKKQLNKIKKLQEGLEEENHTLRLQLEMYKDMATRQSKELEHLNKSLTDATVELSHKQEEIEQLQLEMETKESEKLDELNRTQSELKEVSRRKETLEEVQAELIRAKKETEALLKEKDQMQKSEIMVILKLSSFWILFK
jgi:DNA repair exonuclease SbcCD ATPase subunit